jgi:hypothetical protein
MIADSLCFQLPISAGALDRIFAGGNSILAGSAEPYPINRAPMVVGSAINSGGRSTGGFYFPCASFREAGADREYQIEAHLRDQSRLIPGCQWFTADR